MGRISGLREEEPSAVLVLGGFLEVGQNQDLKTWESCGGAGMREGRGRHSQKGYNRGKSLETEIEVAVMAWVTSPISS